MSSILILSTKIPKPGFALGFFDAVVLVKPDDFAGCLVKFGVVIDQVLENLFLAVELDAVAMYPFPKLAAVVETDLRKR